MLLKLLFIVPYPLLLVRMGRAESKSLSMPSSLLFSCILSISKVKLEAALWLVTSPLKSSYSEVISDLRRLI